MEEGHAAEVDVANTWSGGLKSGSGNFQTFSYAPPMKILLIPLIALFGAMPVLANFSELMKAGDVHDANFQSDEALKYYLPAEKLEPTNADLLVKISRQYALRMNDLPKDADKIASCRKALAYAERAVASEPKRCDSHLAVAICLGRLTPYLGAREKVETSRKIKTSAEMAVKLDPKNDYAWHLLGRWHQSLANVGGATRLLASIIYDGLPAASNAQAVEAFKKAIALNPKRLVHFIELGRTYEMMGNPQEAKRYLELGLSMPNKEKDDPDNKIRGRTTLKEIS
jgi:tetratricopeptide (TPR) repeat protein